MKDEFGKAVEEFEEDHWHGVSKSDFAHIFGKAFLKAASEPTIKAAFSATGIIPSNPNVITSDKLKPSKPSPTMGSSPLTQPSPIQAIINIFQGYHITEAD